MWTLIDSPLSSAWLEVQLGSGCLKVRFSSARLGSVLLYSGSTQLIWFDSGFYSELGLVRLSCGLELGSGGAVEVWSTDESCVVFDMFSTESQWDPIFLHQIWSEPFKSLLPVLGSGFGSAWLGARLDWAPDRCSAWIRARFVSRLGTRGFDPTYSRLGSVCLRPGSARG